MTIILKQKVVETDMELRWRGGGGMFQVFFKWTRNGLDLRLDNTVSDAVRSILYFSNPNHFHAAHTLEKSLI